MSPEQTQFDVLTKEGLVNELSLVFKEVVDCMEAIPKNKLASTIDGKWPAGMQLNHLVKSVKPVLFGVNLPHFVLALFGKGKKVRSLKELIEDYHAGMTESPKAPLGFKPKAQYDVARDLQTWKTLEQKLIGSVAKKTDQQLNRFRLIHPTMGFVTMRDILLFTIYHTRIHIRSIQTVQKALQ